MKMSMYFQGLSRDNLFPMVTFYIYYSQVVVQFVCSLWSDTHALHGEPMEQGGEKEPLLGRRNNHTPSTKVCYQ